MTINDIYHFGSSLTQHYVLLLTCVIAAFVIVLFFARNNIRQAWQTMRTRYRLNHLGIRELANFRFPDGMGNYFSIDRLVMRADGISLLVFKPYSGSIFCADEINEWTQLLAGKSYRFKNPLIELDYQINTISAAIPGVAVDGFLFFDHRARFPKGHPKRVIHFDQIPQILHRNKQHKANAAVEVAWEQLRALSASA